MSKSKTSVASRRPNSKAGGVSASGGTPVLRAASKTKSTDGADIMSFKEALVLAESSGKKQKHLMLGNGFSIALRPEIFTYNTLLERAKVSQKLSAEMEKVFKELGTTDFEMVMEALENAAVLVLLFEGRSPKLAKRFQEEAARLRDVLAETIAEHHPERPYDVADEQYASCKRFLANFNGNIYTLNYDLLLYWTLMQSEIQPDVKSDDGFRNSDEGEEDYVVWDVQNTNHQRVFYLHGALHIYDAGSELLKFTWSKTETALIDQIKQSLAKRQYPLIVTEGTSKQKKKRIQHNSFLGRAFRSFGEIGGNLFIYGHSLAENDEHLLKLIDKGKTSKIFIGIYGDPATERNRKIIERAKLIPTRRRQNGTPAEVHFFDAESAHVWDDEGFDAAN